MGRKFTKSFYDWCTENKREDLLDRWDYNLNINSPKKVGSQTRKKYYFKCPNNLHSSELKDLRCITQDSNISVVCIRCNSFAQWGINNLGKDFLEKYWNYEKNQNVDPWAIAKKSHCIIYIKCQDKQYHGSYSIVCSAFTDGVRCGYCDGKKTHPQDSFAQFHINNTDKEFLNKYWSNKNSLNPWNISPYANKYVLLKCQNKDYHGEYKIKANSFSYGQRCGYCGSTHKFHYLDSLGSQFPNVLNIWSNKNKKTPYEYSIHSASMVWWKCPDKKHNDFQRKITNSNYLNFRCPECVRERDESFLQEKVRLYITDKYGYKLNHERNCTIIPQNSRYKGSRGHMPFDNEIVELKLLIEVHGQQHYQICEWDDRKTNPEQELKNRRIRDRYKRIISKISGYHYLEIPYWTEKDESYKQLIDKKIDSILNGVII
jgi:hypothetical protein